MFFLSQDDRKANHQRRHQYVMHHSIQFWASTFLKHLDAAARMCDSLNFVQVAYACVRAGVRACVCGRACARVRMHVCGLGSQPCDSLNFVQCLCFRYKNGGSQPNLALFHPGWMGL